MKGYDDAGYASTRLTDTVVRTKDKGTPVLVHNILMSDNGPIVNCLDVLDKKDVVIPLDELDVNPPPLGYVNHGANATYVTRMPMRKDWKQGVRTSNMSTLQGYNPIRLSLKHIGTTIIGKYPSFNSVVKAVRRAKPAQSMAFSRDFAVLHGDIIEYKGKFKVGKVEEDLSINLYDEFHWVNEALIESLGEVA